MNPSQPVSWFRATNNDARRCPKEMFMFNDYEIFCDRVTNNRNVQAAFRQRFSVPGLRTENENGLIISTVELSDAGIYACLEHSTNTFLTRINLTVSEGQLNDFRRVLKDA